MVICNIFLQSGRDFKEAKDSFLNSYIILIGKLIVMNHGTISKTVPWLKSVTIIEP